MLAECLEEAIRKLEESTASRDEQLQYISHTVSNHVQMINGTLEELCESATNEQQHWLHKIIARVRSLMQLAHELKSLRSRRYADRPRPGLDKELFNLVLLVQQTCDLYANDEAHHRARVYMEPCTHNALYIYAHREHMNSVVDELIGNALRYVKNDGSGEVKLSIEADNTTVWLHVADNGQGIKEKDKARVFETSVYDLKRGQTGYGLAVVQNIIKEHAGDIDLESEEGVGTTFSISLPLSAAPEDAPYTSPPTLELESGHTQQKYLVVRPIQMGQAHAYEASDRQHNRYWVKLASEQDAPQFKHLAYEARLFAGTRHTNAPIRHRSLIQMIDWGQRRDPDTSELSRFLVFAPAPGKPLQLILETEPQMELAWALSIGRHLAELLVYLHAQGIIVRTLSPAAIYTDNSQQQTTLIDLSAARHERDLEQIQDIPVSDVYISPEQINGTLPGRRSDIYVFGVLLFELLAGQQPFNTTIDHMSAQPPDPQALREDIPDALAKIVLRCLQKWPTDRYAYAGELLEALHAVQY
jgi:two-component sensor histidine kinase